MSSSDKGFDHADEALEFIGIGDAEFYVLAEGGIEVDDFVDTVEREVYEDFGDAVSEVVLDEEVEEVEEADELFALMEFELHEVAAAVESELESGSACGVVVLGEEAVFDAVAVDFGFGVGLEDEALGDGGFNLAVEFDGGQGAVDGFVWETDDIGGLDADLVFIEELSGGDDGFVADIAFEEVAANLVKTVFDAVVDAVASGVFHGGDHFLVDGVDTDVADKGDGDFVAVSFEEFHEPFAVDVHGVGDDLKPFHAVVVADVLDFGDGFVDSVEGQVLSVSAVEVFEDMVEAVAAIEWASFCDHDLFGGGVGKGGVFAEIEVVIGHGEGGELEAGSDIVAMDDGGGVLVLDPEVGNLVIRFAVVDGVGECEQGILTVAEADHIQSGGVDDLGVESGVRSAHDDDCIGDGLFKFTDPFECEGESGGHGGEADEVGFETGDGVE